MYNSITYTKRTHDNRIHACEESIFKNKFKFGANCLQAVEAVRQTHKQYIPRNLKFYLIQYTMCIDSY